MVLLSGEAGIGKSRLVQVVKERVASESQAWLMPCQCSPYYQHTPLYPMIELLERVALRFEREESPPQKLSKLEGFLVQYGLPLTEAALTMATEQGFVVFIALGLIHRGWALAAQGRPLDGLVQIRQGLDSWQAIGAYTRPYYLALLAGVYGQVGQLEEGLRALTEALAAVEATGERFMEAELYRLKGELWLARSSENPLAAETCFQQALAVAGRQQAKSFELRAAMSLSRLWQHQGKREEACELLAPIYGWFSEGFDTADLQEAKALLEALA